MIAIFIIIFWLAITDGYALAKHGEEKEGTYSFWWSLTSTILWVALLYWAGTFDKLLN